MIALLLACAAETADPAVPAPVVAPDQTWETTCEADGRATIDDPALGAAVEEGPLYADQCGCSSADTCFCTTENLRLYVYDWGADLTCTVGWTVRISE